MELEDMWYRLERDGETLKGFYATFSDGHTERWDDLGEKISDIKIWGFQPDLSGLTAGEMVATLQQTTNKNNCQCKLKIQ